MDNNLRVWRYARRFLGNALGVLAVVLTAAATRAQTTVSQTFSTTNPAYWSFTGSSSGSFSKPQSGYSAGGTTWLELANTTTNISSAAVYTGAPISASGSTIYATFNYQMYGGYGGTTNGGDGLTFFLYDASQTFSTGAYGGSLGYAQKTGINGMNGGYLGIGLDAYGNYSAASEGRVGGYNGTTQPVTESVAVRGPGQGTNGYAYLGGTGVQLDNGTNIDSTSITSTNNTVQILLSATNQLTVTLSKGSSTPQTVLQMDLSGYARPDLLSFGFTAGTGNATDYILVNGLTVTTMTASRWTNAGQNGNWGLNTNWNPSVVPTANSDILFDNSSVSAPQTISTGTNRTVRSLMFDAPFSYTIDSSSSKNTITIDNNNVPGFTGVAVTQTHGSADHTINSNLALNDAATIRNNSSGTLTVNGTITNGGNALTVDGTGSSVLGGAISGAGALVKNDSGTVTLSAANTYSGGTTINNGTVNANTATALGTAGVTLAGGALSSTASTGISIGNAITLTGDASIANLTTTGTLTQSAGNRVLNLSNATQSGTVNLSNNTTARTLTVQVDSGSSTISGAIANGGGSTGSGLTKTGSGTLILSGSNTYTGATTISNGTLQLGASNRLGNSSSLRIDSSGTLNLAGFSEQVGALTVLNGGATIDFGATGGANTFVFGTYTAPSSGVLVINNFQNGTDTLATSVSQTIGSIYLSGLGIATVDKNTSSTTYGNAYLLRPGTQNTTTWAGANSTWSTGTNWSGGAAPTTSQIAVFGASGVTAVTLDGNTTVAGLQFASNAQSFTISGNKTLTLSGTIPYIQQKSANVETFSAALSVGANSVIDMTGSGNLVLSGNISGTGNLVKDGPGAGKLILSGTNSSYTGDIYINTGILQAGSATALGNATATAVNIAQGATLELAAGATAGNTLSIIGTGANNAGAIHNVAGANTLSGTITETGDTTIAADAGTSLTLSGNLTASAANTTLTGTGDITAARITTGTGGVTVATTGNVTFNGSTANTYTGDTVVNSGKLILAKSPGTTAIAGNLLINAGTVQLGANDQISGTSVVSLAGTSTFDLNSHSDTIAQLSGTSATTTVALGTGSLGINAVNNQNSNYAGTITGAAGSSLTVTGTGKVYLSGDNSGFAGNINVTSGTLNASGSNYALGTGGVTIGSGGNLQVQGGISLANAFLVNGTGTSYNGAIQNVGGSNVLSGAVTLNSGTLIESDAGTLTLGGGLGLGSNTATITGNGNTVVSGVVSGTGGIAKNGSGALTMSASNTYSGPTAINSGLVTAGATSALGTGAVTVANGAALNTQGTSTLGNSFTVTGTGLSGTGAIRNTSGTNVLSGTVSLGGNTRVQSDSGTLTLGGGVSLGGNTLTIGGAGSTLVSGTISGSGGLTKTDAGTLTLTSTNSYAGPTAVNGGTLALNASNAVSATASLTVSSGATVSLANSVSQTVAGLGTTATSTVSVGANAVLTINSASASSLLGTISGTGTIAYTGGHGLTLNTSSNFAGTLSYTGGGTVTLGNSLNFTNGTLEIGGSGTTTLLLGSNNVSVGTLHITGNTILDFGNSTSTSLNATNLIIDTGVTVTVKNWVNVSNMFVAQNFFSHNVSTGTNTTAPQNTSGTTPVNQIGFNGYSNNQTVWQGYDHQITPAPEPATYGALFIGAALSVFGVRRWRKQRKTLRA